MEMLKQVQQDIGLEMLKQTCPDEYQSSARHLKGWNGKFGVKRESHINNS